jgi:hypothetical protein
MRRSSLQIDAFPVHDGDMYTAYRNVRSLEFNVNTFRGHLQLSALGDLDGLDGFVRLGLDLLDLLNDVKALEDFAEDDVTAIEPPITLLVAGYLVKLGRVFLRGDDGGDKELRAVGVLASVGHGQETLLGVLELEVLIGELLAVDCSANR